MKKFITLIIFTVSIFCLSQKAVAQNAMENPNGFILDTASQAAAEGPTIRVGGVKKTVSIVVATTKISGTIAGTVAWQGSNDGVHYATISTSSLVDGSVNYLYKETDKGYLYYKALITQTGTSSLSYAGTEYDTGPGGN